jgi:hypothetical protein
MAKSFPNTGATIGLAADRTAMTGMYAGQYFYETDTGLMFTYTGSAWILPYEQRVAQVNASGSATNMTVSSLSQAGNHMRIVASFRSSRATFSTTGGRFLINGLSGVSDYGISYNTTNAGLQNIGYIGQIPAATALANDVAIVNMWIPNYRNQNSLNRMNINAVATSYAGGTFTTHNYVGGTTSCGAVTSITFQDDVGSTLAASVNNFSVYISN